MNEEAVLAAARAHRAAWEALDVFLRSGARPSWRGDAEDVTKDIQRENRVRRVELTEAVSQTRIHLLDVVRSG